MTVPPLSLTTAVITSPFDRRRTQGCEVFRLTVPGMSVAAVARKKNPQATLYGSHPRTVAPSVVPPLHVARAAEVPGDAPPPLIACTSNVSPAQTSPLARRAMSEGGSDTGTPGTPPPWVAVAKSASVRSRTAIASFGSGTMNPRV